MAKLSVIVPARNEQFLLPTVLDVLSKARGEIEIIAVLDGWWPNPSLPDTDPRLRTLHFGDSRGMRPAINAATAIATGDYFMKLDGHCLMAEGFDEVMKAEYQEDNWILTPRRQPLDPERWAIDQRKDKKYPVDYEYLSYPFERLDDPTCGFHGTAWPERRDARAEILLDEDMSSQGSCWMMSKKHWQRLSPMRIDLFGNFYGESQEIGLKTQLAGGKMMRTKRTHYAHLFKGKRWGRGYVLGPQGHQRGAREILRLSMLNLWPGQTRTLQSLIEAFSPVPGWPADLDQCFRDAKRQMEQVA